MEPTLEPEHYNNSIIYLSEEDPINKYNSISKIYTNLQTELEEKDQLVYDCKRELTRLNTLELEYVSEIESLQSHESSECEKLKTKIHDLENKKNVLNCQHAKKIKDLEQTIFKGDEEIRKLQNELETLKNACNLKNEATGIDDLELKNTEFINVINHLENETILLKDRSHFLEEQHLMNIAQRNNIQKDLNILKENYEHIKEELNEAKQLNESLQEDLILSKQELEVVKSKPLQDGSQGNSLFAEVDNKRLELQGRMALMESQYLKMKNERAKLLSEITILNSTNAMLCQRWETDSKDSISENKTVEEGYREKINILETELETCINEVLCAQKIISKHLKPGETQFMENMLEAKNKEIVEVLRQGESYSLSNISISCELRESNWEMRHWRAKATKFEFEIGKLQAEIEALKLKQMQTVAPSKSKKSILKDVGNAIARINALDDGFSMVDYSRQIKRFRLRNDTSSKSIGSTDHVTDKEGVALKEEVQSLNNVSQNIYCSINFGKKSEIDTSKLKEGDRVGYCKPVVFKKKY